MITTDKGFFGSDNTQVSVADEEILQKHKKTDWFSKRLNVKKFSFSAASSCHVKINEGEPIFLPTGIFEMDTTDTPIWDFRIVESGINYTYLGGY